jgi:hypothetical protein
VARPLLRLAVGAPPGGALRETIDAVSRGAMDRNPGMDWWCLCSAVTIATGLDRQEHPASHATDHAPPTDVGSLLVTAPWGESRGHLPEARAHFEHARTTHHASFEHFVAIAEPRRARLRVAPNVMRNDAGPMDLIATCENKSASVSIACDLVAERGWTDDTIRHLRTLFGR